MTVTEPDVVAVGAVLRELRGMTDLSAIQASLRLGVGKSCVGMWERGDRAITVEKFLDLAEIYGVDAGLALDLMAIRCGRAHFTTSGAPT